jgi:hypothetical protein
MPLRDNILFALKLPRGCENAFTRSRIKRASRSPFMRGRQAPYAGWQDRRSGHYCMQHNKICDSAEL